MTCRRPAPALADLGVWGELWLTATEQCTCTPSWMRTAWGWGGGQGAMLCSRSAAVGHVIPAGSCRGATCQACDRLLKWWWSLFCKKLNGMRKGILKLYQGFCNISFSVDHPTVKRLAFRATGKNRFMLLQVFPLPRMCAMVLVPQWLCEVPSQHR